MPLILVEAGYVLLCRRLLQLAPSRFTEPVIRTVASEFQSDAVSVGVCVPQKVPLWTETSLISRAPGCGQIWSVGMIHNSPIAVWRGRVIM
jgi:hypothetical protein